MGKSASVTNRRPLKARSTSWAATAAKGAIAIGLGPNLISFLGILVAALGAWAIISGPRFPYLFLVGAAAIQLRLMANMLDGMVAVEGGKGGPTGAIWNEFPDRVEDSLFLVAAGYASGFAWLGWTAALLAAICAYVRLLGGSMGFDQDFIGPQAKPHRMFVLTVTLVASFFWFGALVWGLGVIIVGTALTIARRLGRLSARLRG
nr:CDP-alcohol phosphatidyltransferase family protein [uncultured Sphingomonas sp.]